MERSVVSAAPSGRTMFRGGSWSGGWRHRLPSHQPCRAFIFHDVAAVVSTAGALGTSAPTPADEAAAKRRKTDSPSRFLPFSRPCSSSLWKSCGAYFPATGTFFAGLCDQSFVGGHM